MQRCCYKLRVAAADDVADVAAVADDDEMLNVVADSIAAAVETVVAAADAAIAAIAVAAVVLLVHYNCLAVIFGPLKLAPALRSLLGCSFHHFF